MESNENKQTYNETNRKQKKIQGLKCKIIIIHRRREAIIYKPAAAADVGDKLDRAETQNHLL